MVRDHDSPSGLKGLSPTYAKELHDAELLSFRTTHVMKLVYEQGGWFFAEYPASRGKVEAAVSYDPSFRSTRASSSRSTG